MSSHILIVEDDPMTAKMLTFVLADAGYRPSALADPRRVAPLLAETPADLALLDTGLPHGDGLTLCTALRRSHPDLPVVFLSSSRSLADTVAGFNAGADDYLAKPFEPQELVARIQAILRRQRRAERNVFGMAIRAGDAALDIGELTFAAPGREPVALTPTEMKILEQLMRNANAVVSREALIERVWGYEVAGGDNRINVYIGRLRGKIERDPTEPEYLQTVRGAGYRFRAASALAAIPSLLRAPSGTPAALGEGRWAATGT